MSDNDDESRKKPPFGEDESDSRDWDDEPLSGDSDDKRYDDDTEDLIEFTSDEYDRKDIESDLPASDSIDSLSSRSTESSDRVVDSYDSYFAEKDRDRADTDDERPLEDFTEGQAGRPVVGALDDDDYDTAIDNALNDDADDAFDEALNELRQDEKPLSGPMSDDTDDLADDEVDFSSEARDKFSAREDDDHNTAADSTLTPGQSPSRHHEDENDDDDWEEFALDEPQETVAENKPAFPMSLIAIAVIAVLLVAAGGYGVMSQRNKQQDEIRDLKARLAQSVSADELGDVRAALNRSLDNSKALERQMGSLEVENARLRERITDVLNKTAVSTPTTVSTPAANTKPAATPKQNATATTRIATPTVSNNSTTSQLSFSGWFVNIASFGREDTAVKLANRLSFSHGRVVVMNASSGGKSIYRVRVVELGNNNEAKQVAGEVVNKYQLPKPWLGKQ